MPSNDSQTPQNTDKSYYFSHDSNAHRDEDILSLRAKHGWRGYGLFWAIVELMREQSDYSLDYSDQLPAKLAVQFGIDPDYAAELIDDCIEFGLFKQEDGRLFSESLLRRMEIKDKKSEQARKAAQKRWNNGDNAEAKRGESDRNADAKPDVCERNADAMPDVCERNADAMQVKESKVKETTTKQRASNKRDNKPPPKEKYNKYAPVNGRGLRFDVIKERWNDRVPKPLQIERMTQNRKDKLRTRYQEEGFSLDRIIDKLQVSPFALGGGKRGWTADFSWIIDSEDNWTRLVEGKYMDRDLSRKDQMLDSIMEWAKEEDAKGEEEKGEDAKGEEEKEGSVEQTGHG